MFQLSDASAIVEKVRPYTMTTPACITATVNAVRHVINNRIPGDLVECGVWLGGSSMAMALAALERESVLRRLWLFDTFAGMTRPAPIDGDEANQAYRDEWLKVDVETVKANMRQTRYPDTLIHYIEGPVESVLPNAIVSLSRVAVVRLDTDWYSSTLIELMAFWPILSPGGVLILDDYACWPGCKLAVDQYFTGQDIHSVPVGAFGIAIVKD